MAVIKSSANSNLAQQFVDFVLSADGQALLAQYGFVQR
ncbi:MAG: substrate-binding domain-containing protein [Anaerolineae bacterium]